MKIKTHITLDEKLNSIVVETARVERRSITAQIEMVMEAGLKALGLLKQDTEQRNEQFTQAFVEEK